MMPEWMRWGWRSQRGAWVRRRFITIVLFVIGTAIGIDDSARSEDGLGFNGKTPRNDEFFETQIRPIFAQRCYECHDIENGDSNGELILATVAGIRRGGSRGELIGGSSPEETLLWQSIAYADPDLQMPPEGKLPPNELEKIRQWLENGAGLPQYKDVPSLSRDRGNGELKGFDWESARDFWAFRPLSTEVPIPETKGSDWARQPLDQFILSALQSNGLTPSPEATKRTLLRRLTLVTKGLLPTAEEAEQFFEDSSVDAYERAVDRMLASPAFGEKAARFWLDLARYTDFTPDWQNPTDRGWMYRDWVVSALNQNMPYDQFVSLQLAADLLPGTSPEDLAALGFLGLSPTYWKELKLAPAVIQQIVADEWDERIDAVSRTFLGLTVACARCHDHKFDPITTSDYYALAGVFASTQFHEQPLVAPDQAEVVLAVRNQIESLQARLKSLDEATKEDAAEYRAEIERLKKSEPRWNAPLAHTLRDASVYVVPDGPDTTKLEYREREARDLPIFRRGNPSNPGEIAPRRYLEVFRSSESIGLFHQGSGRSELVMAMLEQSQGLVARVIVNRIWFQVFGEGFVRTPSDFGTQGDPPTHPELLEYLAAEFVSRNWDIKWLYSQLLKSATWKQSTLYRQNAFEVDPENKLLWRMNRRPLEFEQWRDAILQASGQLDRRMFGPSAPVDDLSNVRRSLYITIAREELHPVLRLHDFPEASAHSPKRTPTITPLQQLFVLNSPWMQEQARLIQVDLDTRQLSEEQSIEFLFERILGRLPSQREQELTIEFLQSASTVRELYGDRLGGPQENVEEVGPSEHSLAWSALIQGLLGLNEFAFID